MSRCSDLGVGGRRRAAAAGKVLKGKGKGKGPFLPNLFRHNPTCGKEDDGTNDR